MWVVPSGCEGGVGYRWAIMWVGNGEMMVWMCGWVMWVLHSRCEGKLGYKWDMWVGNGEMMVWMCGLVV